MNDINSLDLDLDAMDLDTLTDILDKKLSARRRPSQREKAYQLKPIILELAKRRPAASGADIARALTEHYKNKGLGPAFKRAVSEIVTPAKPCKRISRKSKPKQSAATPELASREFAQPHPSPPCSASTSPTSNEAELLSAAAARPYRYNERFAGMVFKTRVAEVTRFFSLIQRYDELAAIQVAAEEIRRSAQARAAINTLEKRDRQIYLDVISSIDRRQSR